MPGPYGQTDRQDPHSSFTVIDHVKSDDKIPPDLASIFIIIRK